MLALGSTDRDRFHPGMSTEFLARMADLIADSLVPRPGAQADRSLTPAALMGRALPALPRAERRSPPHTDGSLRA